jgi:hypothetical protein
MVRKYLRLLFPSEPIPSSLLLPLLLLPAAGTLLGVAPTASEATADRGWWLPSLATQAIPADAKPSPPLSSSCWPPPPQAVGTSLHRVVTAAASICKSTAGCGHPSTPISPQNRSGGGKGSHTAAATLQQEDACGWRRRGGDRRRRHRDEFDEVAA